MTVNEVLDFLMKNNLSHSSIKNIDKEKNFSEYYLYDKTNYILVFNYPIGDMVIDTLGIYFIKDFVLKASWDKRLSYFWSPYDTEQITQRKKQKDSILYAKYSNVFYKINDGLKSKYGQPQKLELNNVDGFDVVIPKVIPSSRNPKMKDDCIQYLVRWGNENSGCEILLEDSYCNWNYSVSRNGVEHTRNIKIISSFPVNDEVRKAINDNFGKMKQNDLLKQTEDAKLKQRIIDDL